MPRHLFAYSSLPAADLPTDVRPGVISGKHPGVGGVRGDRPVNPLVSFVLARTDITGRMPMVIPGFSPKHTDLVGARLPDRLCGWEPAARLEPWPEAIGERLADCGLEHITPRHAAVAWFPKTDHAKLPVLKETPGVPELYVWAHGLELTPAELKLATRGMAELLQDPFFLIWAANPQAEYIPWGYAYGVSPLKRLRLRGQVLKNPLAFTPSERPLILNLNQATPERIIELPRNERWTPRSSNLSLDPEILAMQLAWQKETRYIARG